MIIGICGKSGSGKSTLANAILESNIHAIHCDIEKVGHQALEAREVKDEAIKCFGDKIITNGKVDRKKLSGLVFSSRDEMKELARITWGPMKQIIDEKIKDNKNGVIILDWILLPDTHYFEMCDIKILVDTPYETRKMRAMKRDNITSYEFDLKDGASIEYRACKFDLVINNTDINEIRKLGKRI